MAVEELALSVRQARRVYIAGNGGSAANAIHLANDFISVGVRAHALTSDVATLTAIANDFGYALVFSSQLEVYAEEGDLLLVLSGSGNSLNIVNAITEANHRKMDTWAIVGAFGIPRAATMARRTIRAGANMQEAEEQQLRIGHEVMLALREKR